MNLRRNGPVRVQFSALYAGLAPGPAHESGWPRAMFRFLAARRSSCVAAKSGGIYVDATFGAGGYSRAILGVPGTRVIGIDRDRTAIAGGFDLVERSDGRLTLVEGRFSQLFEICTAQGFSSVDGVVMDVGVSSMQLDEAGRGFSFRLDGPLDMRMGQDGPTAAEVIAKASEADLADIIYVFGEERRSRSRRPRHCRRAQGSSGHDHAGARRHRRQSGARRSPARYTPRRARFRACGFSSTRNSTSCNWRCRRRSACSSPAAVSSWCRFIRWKTASSRIFSPIAARRPAARGICPSSRRQHQAFRFLTKRPVTPSEQEIAANPRARSAKLRAAERTEAPAHAADALPDWPKLADVMGGG